MNAYETYLSSLPKPKTDAEKDSLKGEGKPFIVGDNLVDKLHDSCGTETKTRVLEIYIPQEDVVLPIEYAHHDSTNPMQSCKTAFEQRMIADGTDRQVIDTFTDIFYKELDLFGDMQPQERLIQSAKIYKAAENYQSGMKRIMELTRELTE